jgi:hypothetical protein
MAIKRLVFPLGRKVPVEPFTGKPEVDHPRLNSVGANTIFLVVLNEGRRGRPLEELESPLLFALLWGVPEDSRDEKEN